MQTLIITSAMVTFGFPVLIIAVFAFFLLRGSKNFKPTENTLGFFLLFSFLVILPFITFVAEIFKHGKGFIGYYLLIPSILSRLYISDKTVLFFFIVYLVSLHVLGILPFLAMSRIVALKRRISETMSVAGDNEAIRELQKLANEIKSARGIRNKVEVKIIDGKGQGCAIMKRGDNAILAIDKSFLESFSSNTITKEETGAILHHEFSHLVDKDYLLPVASMAILNKQFALMTCFSFSFYLGINAKYSFFNDGLLYRMRLASWPIILTIMPPFLSFCLVIGFLLWAVSMFLRRCEILADNLAVQHVPKKTLIDAIVKMNVLSGSAGILAMPFASNEELKKKNRTFFEDFVHALKTMNIFSSYNKIYFHPNVAERIKSLNNPQVIIEEENAGLLRFEVFSIVGILAAFVPQAILLMSEWFIRNVNWQDVNLANLSYMLYFLLVLLVCIPFQYSKKRFVYNPTSVKLIAVYSIFISVFVNLFPAIKNASLIFQDFNGKNEFVVRMFIKSQISRIINLLISGFFFAVIMFVIFIAIGNFIIRMRVKKSSESKVIV